MARKATIENALPIVAAHYGEKFGVNVVVGRTNAYTDGNTINVPNLPADYPNKDVVWGYLAHEAAHVRETDFDLWRSLAPQDDMRRSILNIIEDTRIEKALMDQFPGVRSDLESTVTYLKDEGTFGSVNSTDEPGLILQAKLLYWLRATVLQQPLSDFAVAAGNAMKDVFPEGVNTRLAVLLRKVASTKSTADCIELTDAILAMLKEEAEKETEKEAGKEPESQQNDSSEGQDPEENSDQPDSSPDGDATSDDSNTDQNSGGGNQQSADSSGTTDSTGSDVLSSRNSGDTSSNQQAQQQGSKVIQAALDADGMDLQADAFEALKQALSAEAEANGDDSYCTVPTAPSCKGNRADGADLLQKVQSTTSKLRAQLLSIVQASQRRSSRTSRSGRKLDNKRLTRIVAGDTRIFKERAERKHAYTAVHLLTDLSSSMQGYAEEVAREASLAIALALEGIPGVNPAVTYFFGNDADPVSSAIRHGESVRRNAHRFIEGARGYTPMAEAIWHGAYELTKVREERRILIVITDGDPNKPFACEKVLELCSNSGIEAIGIGICHSSVSRLFDNHIVIHSVGELSKTLFKLMKNVLVTQAA